MKILFLIPPSEGKNNFNNHSIEKLSFDFNKPLEIAHNVCEKDLKCSWTRFLEWIKLNKNIETTESIDAINRYSWVMYNSINYQWMTTKWRKFFQEHFLIFSWMYWIVRPIDKIWNYKLPIETKWLYKYWWDIIPKAIIDLKVDYIVNLLPISYAKLIWEYTKCNRHKKKKEAILDSGTKIINVNFVKSKQPPLTPPYQGENRTYIKISHWVKKIKWEWIKNICEKNICDYRQFWWEVIEYWKVIDVNVIM